MANESILTRWSDIPVEHLNPYIDRQYVVGTNIMLTQFLLKKGAHVPLHSHDNEQVSHIVSGVIKFVLEGKEVLVRGGEILCIPPGVPHEAIVLEDVLAFDIFSPPRQDWIDREDSYLRGDSNPPLSK